MPVGFMSERTAEYVLVPDLVRRFGQCFAHVVPFYYWATREGTPRVASSCRERVRLVAAYARRPKLDHDCEHRVTVKVNERLFDHASILRQSGVPTFAGVPCVSRLSDHRLGATSAWFLPSGGLEKRGDALISIDISDHPAVARELTTGIHGPMATDEILQSVFRYGKEMDWSQAFTVIREATRCLSVESSSRRFYGVLSYKPFYLVCSSVMLNPSIDYQERHPRVPVNRGISSCSDLMGQVSGI